MAVVLSHLVHGGSLPGDPACLLLCLVSSHYGELSPQPLSLGALGNRAFLCSRHSPGPGGGLPGLLSGLERHPLWHGYNRQQDLDYFSLLDSGYGFIQGQPLSACKGRKLPDRFTMLLLAGASWMRPNCNGISDTAQYLIPLWAGPGFHFRARKWTDRAPATMHMARKYNVWLKL